MKKQTTKTPTQKESILGKNDPQKNIAYANSFAWVGGKHELRPKIAKLIPKDIMQYVEPFGGAGWVMFFKEKWAKFEIYNDINDNLTNLFTMMKYHPDELCKEIETILPTETKFNNLKNNYIAQTEIQKAAQFYILLRFSFSAKQTSYACSNFTHQNSIFKLQDVIKALYKRLDRVTIINKDYEKVITKYDTQGTFFYLDPPYYNYSEQLKSVYKEIDHKNLFNILKNIKSRFLLSYNDEPFIRDLYKDFHIFPISKTNKFANVKGIKKGYNELLIANYKLEEI